MKKCFSFQFDVSDSCSVRIEACSLEEACHTFRTIFGSFLFSQVKTIYNLNNHAEKSTI